MSTASQTSLPAQTILEVADAMVEAEAIPAGSRLYFINGMVRAAQRRGLDPHGLIDGDVLDSMTADVLL